MKKAPQYVLIALFGLMLLQACNPAKHVADGDYILQYERSYLGYYENIDVDNPDVDVDELQSIIKQVPNRRILGMFRFHMWIYPKDTNKINRKIEKNWQDHIEKNQKRLDKGKDTVEYKPCGIERRMKNGEPIILLDTNLTASSVEQLNLYLIKKGYFHNTVHDSIIYNEKKKTATVWYVIETNEPYTIRHIELDINDNVMEKYVGFYQKQSLLDSGDVFDIDILEKERSKMTTYLRDRGYHFFTKDFISFDVDSSLALNQVDIVIKFENILKKSPLNPDEFIEVTHKRYQISNIIVNTDYDAFLGDEIANYDSSSYNGITFLYQGELMYSPKLLSQFVFVSNGEIYRQKDIESTLRRFNSSGVFNSVSIRYEVNPYDPLALDCYIRLRPAKRQSFSMQADGTYKGGNYGIRGNISYSNRNTFKGAELFKVSISGSIEEQPLFSNVESEEGGVVQQVTSTFNTAEFGPQISLHFPKFLLPIAPDRFKKTFQPTTVLSALVNFQARPDYQRNIQSYSWSYEWGKENIEKGSNVFHRYQLLEFSTWDIKNEAQEFLDYLDNLNNAALSSSFLDHIILGSRYSMTYNTQLFHSGNQKLFLQANFGAAGLILRSIHQLMDKNDWLGVRQDTLGQYSLNQIPYSQYVRGEGDLRFYHSFNQSSKVVLRAAGGIGIPYGNAQALPFEKSFFTGGANTLRAWRARTIGPGSYSAIGVEHVPDKIGDIMLEGNVEYRFDMLGFFEGALFLDVGNIWILAEDTNRPGAQFSTDFWKEFAIGGGFGARFDFDFFIIRLDLATQLHDPRLPEGQRWAWSGKDGYNETYGHPYTWNFNFNFGIGYPF